MSITESEVFAQAVDNAGFLWCQRDAATGDARFKLKDLVELDARLAAQLDLLRRGGAGAFQACAAAAAEGGAGEVFAAAALALRRGDREGLAPLLAQAMEAPALARGAASAMAWAAPDEVREVLPALLDPGAPPPLRAIGIAASAARRRHPGQALRGALDAEDPRLRARALRAAGEVGLVEMAADLARAAAAEDPACRFWAAWSAALLGNGAGVEALLHITTGGGPFAERAAALALRCAGPLAGGRFLRALPETPRGSRVALVGAGALGDPALISSLIDRMRVPAAARLAGAALSMITGVDIVHESMEGPALEETGPTEDPADEDVTTSADDALPWPDAAAVERWWARRRADFPAGTRHLAGKPIDLASANEVLRSGTQPARAAAAIERCRIRPRMGLFEVRARGDRQRAELGG